SFATSNEVMCRNAIDTAEAQGQAFLRPDRVLQAGAPKVLVRDRNMDGVYRVGCFCSVLFPWIAQVRACQVKVSILENLGEGLHFHHDSPTAISRLNIERDWPQDSTVLSIKIIGRSFISRRCLDTKAQRYVFG